MQREEKIKWLNEAPTTEVIKDIRYLNPEDQKTLQTQYVRKAALFQLNTDAEDKKYTHQIFNSYLMLLLCPIPIKLLEKFAGPRTKTFQTLLPPLQKVISLTTLHKGIVPYSIILLNSSIQIVRNSTRVGYKHFLIDQMNNKE